MMVSIEEGEQEVGGVDFLLRRPGWPGVVVEFAGLDAVKEGREGGGAGAEDGVTFVGLAEFDQVVVSRTSTHSLLIDTQRRPDT
ncbi:hypothetical protein [Kitasatospora azatica]|uniref:hypothetical protein n=1 Tax=Kitasatospora azatica TaxID=58347 RepID=UPI0012FBB65C|nr:hypothetical protein [Kitasatospora azatica]